MAKDSQVMDQTMTVRVKKKIPGQVVIEKYAANGILIGNRFYTHADGAVILPTKQAQELIKAGFVEVITRFPRDEAEHR